ncbi:MAG: hypothetical protein GY720_00100 [bacterium]|nr:hypothetical protein [bacterium]
MGDAALVIHDLATQLAEARAAETGVGVIVRVPLASGLLTGKMSASSRFAADDHRTFNRKGEAFDMGETFSGVPFDQGLAAVDALRGLVPDGATLAQLALRWILMFEGVSTVIPGAKTPTQVIDNTAASDLVPLDGITMAGSLESTTSSSAPRSTTAGRRRRRIAQLALGDPASSPTCPTTWQPSCRAAWVPRPPTLLRSPSVEQFAQP